MLVASAALRTPEKVSVDITRMGPGADGARNQRFPAAGFVYMERHDAWSLKQATLAAGQPPTPPSMTKRIPLSAAEKAYGFSGCLPYGARHLRTLI